MKRILIAAMLVATPAFAADNPAAKADDAIKAAFARFDTCMANKDTRCLDDLVADDATFAGPMDSGKLIKGKAATMNALAQAMNDPFMKGARQKRTVQNVRMIGQDRALVDGSVEFVGMKVPESAVATGTGQLSHFTALLALKGGKWVVEDIRSWVIFIPLQPSTPAQPAPTTGAPAQPAQPAAPAQPAQPNAPPQR